MLTEIHFETLSPYGPLIVLSAEQYYIASESAAALIAVISNCQLRICVKCGILTQDEQTIDSIRT